LTNLTKPALCSQSRRNSRFPAPDISSSTSTSGNQADHATGDFTNIAATRPGSSQVSSGQRLIFALRLNCSLKSRPEFQTAAGRQAPECPDSRHKTGVELIAVRKDIQTLELNLKTMRSKYRLSELKGLGKRLAGAPNDLPDERSRCFLAVKNELAGLYTGPLAPEEDPQIIRRMLELLWQKALVFKTPDPAAFAALIPLEKAWQTSIKEPGTLFPLEKITLAELSQALTDLVAQLFNGIPFPPCPSRNRLRPARLCRPS